MRPHVRTFAVATAFATACGGAVQQAHNPWLVPPDRIASILQTVHTVGLAPVTAPDGLQNPAPVQAMFDSLVGEQLRAAGFSVVRVPEFWSYYEAQVKEYGIGDPATGEPDTAKVRVVQEHTSQGLLARYHVDAWLTPALVDVSVPVHGGTANWHGTSQSLGSLWDRLTMQTCCTGGRLPAYSLCARLWDLNGGVLYHEDGGIELAGMPPGRGDPPTQVKMIDRARLFLDAGRNLQAARLALGPLVSRGKSPQVSTTH